MKTLTSVLMMALLLAAGCGGGDDGTTPPPPPASDAEVLAAAWTALGQGDTDGAETEFRLLVSRDALLPQAFDGLGWTFTVAAEPDSALANFQRAVAVGVDTTSVQKQARAGHCFAENARGHHAEAVTAGELVTPPWSLTIVETYDFEDVALTLAASHYMLGNFEESLTALNLVVDFLVDVDTVEGRAALAAMIEELLNS